MQYQFFKKIIWTSLQKQCRRQRISEAEDSQNKLFSVKLKKRGKIQNLSKAKNK